MAMPGVLLALPFKSITCFGRAFQFIGALVVMIDDDIYFRFGAC